MHPSNIGWVLTHVDKGDEEGRVEDDKLAQGTQALDEVGRGDGGGSVLKRTFLRYYGLQLVPNQHWLYH